IPPKKEKEKTAYDIEIENLQNKLSSAMGTKVKINHSPKKGKIEIEYYGNDDLERILEFFKIEGE
ncbi:MAG: chromosome partitioning protein ParB, partial [Hominilimicola sp.]